MSCEVRGSSAQSAVGSDSQALSLLVGAAVADVRDGSQRHLGGTFRAVVSKTPR